jgi:glycosyltransferase involved in cell wall biosynthesis
VAVTVRVILDSSVSHSGGVARHLLDLADGLRDRSVDVALALPDDDGPLHRDARTRGLKVVRHHQVRRADVVHVHLANTYDRRALTRILSYKRHARVVVTEHLPHSNASDPNLSFGGTSALRRDAKTVLKRLQLSLVDLTIVLSSHCQRFMLRRYRMPSDKLRVISSGMPPPHDAPERTRTSDQVVAIGSLSAQKGFDVLIRAAAGQQAWAATIYGEGTSRPELQKLIADLKAPVRLAGWAERESVPLESSAVLAIPSRWEALPYVALEAMHAATPIVASRVDGLTDLLDDGATGLLVEPEHPRELSRAIGRLIDDPPLARRYGEAGRSRAVERFSYEAMIETTHQAYQDVRRM